LSQERRGGAPRARQGEEGLRPHGGGHDGPERPRCVMAHSPLPTVGLQGGPMEVAVQSRPQHLAEALGGIGGLDQRDARGGSRLEEVAMG
jgi:hypothetical protein